MVTVENLYVPDKPAGILLSKYTMLRQRKGKKEKITEVHEAEGIFHSSVMFEPLCECISFLNQPAHIVFLTLRPFDQPVLKLTEQH